jgi:hypothetical protein
MGVSGQHHSPAALYPGKGPPVTIGQGAGWAPDPAWTQRVEEKSSASVRDRTPVIQSVVSHHTDWATSALCWITYVRIYSDNLSKFIKISRKFMWLYAYIIFIRDLNNTSYQVIGSWTTNKRISTYLRVILHMTYANNTAHISIFPLQVFHNQ